MNNTIQSKASLYPRPVYHRLSHPVYGQDAELSTLHLCICPKGLQAARCVVCHLERVVIQSLRNHPPSQEKSDCTFDPSRPHSALTPIKRP